MEIMLPTATDLCDIHLIVYTNLFAHRFCVTPSQRNNCAACWMPHLLLRLSRQHIQVMLTLTTLLLPSSHCSPPSHQLPHMHHHAHRIDLNAVRPLPSWPLFACAAVAVPRSAVSREPAGYRAWLEPRLGHARQTLYVGTKLEALQLLSAPIHQSPAEAN